MTVTNSQTDVQAIEEDDDDSASSFGAGIFTDDNGNMQLSDRLKALARGEAPEDNPADEEEPQPDEPEAKEVTSEKPVAKEPTAKASTFSDEDKALAAKYQISDDELSEFGSPAALKRAVAVIERSVSKPSAQDNADGVDTKVVDASPSDNAVGDKKEEGGSVSFDVAKLLETFKEDPETCEVIKAVGSVLDDNKSLKEIVTRLEKREQEREQETVRNQFHDKLDAMPDEFGLSRRNGKDISLTPEQVAAREKVRDAAETIYQGYVSQNKPVPPLSDLLDQAIRMVNGVPRKSDDKRVALKAQSAMRRTTGSAAAAASRQPPQKTDGSPAAIARSPKVREFWQRAQEENGALP